MVIGAAALGSPISKPAPLLCSSEGFGELAQPSLETHSELQADVTDMRPPLSPLAGAGRCSSRVAL